MQKNFVCPYENCSKIFGSEASQNLHMKIKHHGGLKSERVSLCKDLIKAYAEAANKLDEKDNNIILDQSFYENNTISLPPGMLSQTARKSGLLSKERLHQFNESLILTSINESLRK